MNSWIGGWSNSVSSLSPPSVSSAADAAAGSVKGDRYAVNDKVEYFGAQQNRWIPTSVKSVNADGTYDLECKPAVPPAKIRRCQGAVAEADDGPLEAGAEVEYYSATHGTWVPAKVLSKNAAGTGTHVYNLDVKPDAPRNKIRWPATQRGGAFTEGDDVEYFSATQGRWISAVVKKVTQGGLYDLDVKPGVAADKVRAPARPMGKESAQPALRLKVGDAVEYFGVSRNKWIPATVVKVNEDDSYDLNCKPGVPIDKIRLPPAAPDGSAFVIGDKVEYTSETLGRWIPTKVIGKNCNGTLNLECKPDVPLDKIRFPLGGSDSTMSLASLKAKAGNLRLNATLSPQSPLSNGLGVIEAFASSPLELLRRSRGKDGNPSIEVCEQAAVALERLGTRPAALVCLCGASRSGKTFLMNYLMERPQKGLPLWSPPTATSTSLWACDLASQGSEDGPILVLLDVESFTGGPTSAAQGFPYDAKLLALCVLLSSLVVMESQAPLGEDVFGDFVSAACCGDLVEERSLETGRPSLLWLLRDLSKERPLRDAQGQLQAPGDHLELALHGETGGPRARSVRQNLLRLFGSRRCIGLGAPYADKRQGLESQNLLADSLPDFKAGLDAFRTEVLASALAGSRNVGGQAMNCLALVALLRQLVPAANEGRVLNLGTAWEMVQHKTCGALVEELRSEAGTQLRSLASGGSLPGGAQLPLSDEALHTVLRDRRRALKCCWEERAFGHETVRREYWQELKESLAREEQLVRTQNTRLADQKLLQALKTWQAWLEEDTADGITAEQICSKVGAMLDGVPTGPLSRTARAAMQAAAQRVTASRSSVNAAMERHGAIQRQAEAWSEQAALKEGAVRQELEVKHRELQDAKTLADELDRAHKEAREALVEHRNELQAAEEEIKAERLRGASVQAALRRELLDVAQVAGDAAEAAATEKHRLEAELAEARSSGSKLQQEALQSQRVLAEERAKFQETHSELSGEQAVLRTKHSESKEDHRRQLETERAAHSSTKDEHKDVLLQHERRAGMLEGQLQAVTAEKEALRERLRELEEKVLAVQVTLHKQAAESEQSKAEVERVKAAAEMQLEREKAEASARLKEHAEELARIRSVEEAKATEPGREKQPKCGCSIQ